MKLYQGQGQWCVPVCPSHLGNRGRRFAWAQEFHTSLGNIEDPISENGGEKKKEKENNEMKAEFVINIRHWSIAVCPRIATHKPGTLLKSIKVDVKRLLVSLQYRNKWQLNRSSSTDMIKWQCVRGFTENPRRQACVKDSECSKASAAAAGLLCCLLRSGRVPHTHILPFPFPGCAFLL